MAIGSVTFDSASNQFQLASYKGIAFKVNDQTKGSVKNYFLGKPSLFWIDDGNKDYRNGPFSYIEV